MTQGVRKLSNKLASFINTRKPIVNVNRHLASSKNNHLLQELSWTQSNTHIPLGKEETLGAGFHHTILSVNQNHDRITKHRHAFIDGSLRAAAKQDCSFVLSNSLTCHTNLLNYNLRSSQINERLIAKYSTSANNPDEKRLPSEDQLEQIRSKLEQQLQKLFVRTLDYSLFTADLVVIDNIEGKTTKGVMQLIKKITSMRIKGHIKYAYVRFDIVKMTLHPEDGSIKVHWRIKGLTTMSVLLNFWKFKPWDITHSLGVVEPLFKWEDGLYTFYVAEKGLIHTCIIDNMVPQEREKIATPLPAKVSAKLSAQVPRPAPGSTSVTETK